MTDPSPRLATCNLLMHVHQKVAIGPKLLHRRVRIFRERSLAKKERAWPRTKMGRRDRRNACGWGCNWLPNTEFLRSGDRGAVSAHRPPSLRGEIAGRCPHPGPPQKSIGAAPAPARFRGKGT